MAVQRKRRLRYYGRGLAVLGMLFRPATAAMTEAAMVVSRRGVDLLSTTTAQTQTSFNSCNFSGTLTLAGSFSLDPEDTFFALGSRQLAAYQLVLDRVNRQCGVDLGTTGRFALELITWDDRSNVNTTRAIAQHMQQLASDIWLGGYTSDLTEPLASTANATHRLLLAPGASEPSVFQDRPTVFGTLPPSSQVLTPAVQGLAHVGAQTLAILYENQAFPRGACTAAIELAQQHGMTVTSTRQVPAAPNASVLVEVAHQFKDANPEVVVTCVYDQGCINWMQAMRQVQWSPKAQVFTVCAGMEQFDTELGADAHYILGVTPWDSSIVGQDQATTWSAADFAAEFQRYTLSPDVPYQAAAAAAVMSIAVQALQATQSTDNTVLADYIATHAFDTLYGNVSFDVNGQNQAPYVLIQRDANGTIQTVWPRNISSSAAAIFYPMPSWIQRDCISSSQCETGGVGTCQPDGSCACRDPLTSSWGVGAGAQCLVYNDNLLTEGVEVFGYVAVGISWGLAIVVLIWIVLRRRRNVIKVAQMEFLCLICIGAMISTGTIIAISFQAGTGEDTTQASTGCAVAPFLYAIGWTLMFSSLCAKTYRLHMIMKNCAKGNQVQVVSFGSMLYIVVFALLVDMSIVIAWTVTNPLVYKRFERGQEVDLATGIVTIDSVGFCWSRDEDGPGVWTFAGPLIAFHVILVFVTNIFLFKVRTMQDRYQESRYITFSMLLMLEVLVVGVPIAVAVSDSNATHVVLVGIVAIHDIGILSFIFLPKMFFQKEANDDEKSEQEKHEQTEDIILASLSVVPSSKFGDAVGIIDDLLRPNSTTRNAMTDEQSSQLRSVKTILMQRNLGKESQLMHVPSQLYKSARTSSTRAITNTKGTLRYILKEFGGVTELMGEESVKSSHSTSRGPQSKGTIDNPDMNGSGASLHLNMDFPRAAGFYTLPEFQNLLSDSQRKNLFHLLTWSNLKRWDFNIFDIKKVTGEHPLLFVGWAILGSPYAQFSMAKACGYEDVSLSDFQGYNFMESRLKIPLQKLCDYLRVIEHDYKDDNPYHNAIHAADVLQTLHSLIQLKADAFDDTDELFSILLAAAVHDVKHPGKNNSFQVNAKTDLALVYNDASVLENKHAAHAFILMLGSNPDQPSDAQDVVERHDELNVLAKVTPDTFAAIRKRIVEAVLNTDMSRHFAKVDAMKALVADNKGGKFDSESRWEVLMYLLHMADISNPAKGDPFFKIWADRCLDEFFAQGDMEDDMGLPISPNCNRKTTEKADSQLGFINFVIKPSFEVLALIMPAVRERILPIIDNNVQYWREQKGKKENV